jgi:hypothetical protein
MFRRWLRRVRDTFVAGAAERRFRLLEAETRDLLVEMQQVMEKLARAAATDARRRSRQIEAELKLRTMMQGGETDALTPAEPQHLTREQRKAQLRARMNGRPFNPQPASSDVVADSGGQEG